MKLIVMDKGHIWNEESKVLLDYAKDVIVISYNYGTPSEHTKPFTYIDVEVPLMLGQDDLQGIKSLAYINLCEHKEEILKAIGDFEDVLVLSDHNPETLYPFKLLQGSKNIGALHLWTIKPFKYMGRIRAKVFNDVVSDLDGIKSLLLIDDSFVEQYKKINELIAAINDFNESELPRVIKQISLMDKDTDWKYFYDMNEKAYIDTTLENSHVDSTEPWYTEWIIDSWYEEELMGDEEEMIPEFDMVLPVPRANGKEICKFLKEARKAFAKANGIEFSTEECKYDGPCSGACPKCDKDLRYLIDEVNKIDAKNRIYPTLDVRN